MKVFSWIFFTMLIFSIKHAFAQPHLSYYLPEHVTYDSKIPTPKSIIYHEVGEFHVTHDRLVNYMMALDKASDRVSFEITGYTHEARPLLLLTITSPANHQNLEKIKAQHVQLTDPASSSSLDTRNMPAVFYLGCSIHGNEPSGSNAALLAAYYFAAAQGPEIENYLQNTVILLDPSFNPDGLQRFSTWANSRKSKLISEDPNDMEHNESWPGGRTNHYWFDLNRDWLVAQHPESQARIKKFHEWKPNVLTDHHEMGTNSTFFFQPGVPSRTHPLTPAKNFELTKKMGEFHAKALDEIGSLYYTQQDFDDFYYGKGSSFADAQGAIGILFEQASSRGHAQESVNGVLTFPFTIRNHFTTMLSSLKAVNALREELLNYQRQFFKDAQSEGAKDPVKAIIFGSPKDKGSSFQLAEIIARQNIDIYRPASAQTINGKNFTSEASYVVPLNQKQYRLIKSMFEKRIKFQDSLFYDISSWTLPLATGVPYEELKIASLGEKVQITKLTQGKLFNDKNEYAYVFEPTEYYAARSIYKLLSHGIRIKVATSPFHNVEGKIFDHGSIIIPLSGQEKSHQSIQFVIKEISEKDGIDVYTFNTGLDYNGSSLGSSDFMTLRKPEIAMLVDGGVSANEAGEMWHLLDARFEIPITMIPLNVFNGTNPGRYNTIIMPPGAYSGINESGKEKLKTWVQNGGIVIGFENALSWLTSAGIGKFDMKKNNSKKDSLQLKAYADFEATQGAQQTSGAIFEAQVDLTHPLLYGYTTKSVTVFRSNNLFMQKSKNAYSNPIVFNSNPLLSGYISKENYSQLKDSSFAGVTAVGKGRVIGFTDNLAFRGFWLGTNRMLLNAIFLGPIISDGTGR
jgi:hypothetical protein